MKKLLVGILVVMLSNVSSAYSAEQQISHKVSITYFGTNEMPPQNESALNENDYLFQFANLDAIRNFERSIVQGMPSDTVSAETWVRQRVEQLDDKITKEILVPIALAMKWDVRRYPAWVFDGNTVVYGVRDARTALEYWRHWNDSKKGER